MYQIIRNLFPPYMAKFARNEVCDKFALADKLYPNDTLPSGQENMWKKQRGLILMHTAPIEDIIPIIRKMEEVIGLSCDTGHSSMRKQDVIPGWPKLPWHQDGAGMDLKEGHRAVVSWVPLDPIDGTRPTLEISEDEEMPLTDHERDEAHFLKADTAPTWSTVLIGIKPGDVVLFSPLTLHRTYFAEDMTNSRLSLDLRFFGPSA